MKKKGQDYAVVIPYVIIKSESGMNPEIEILGDIEMIGIYDCF